jgi:hypothetical protein
VGKIFVDERVMGTEISKGALVTSPVNRLVVLQPSYLPWIGYFEQMERADQFIFLDDVQYTRRDWRNRNKIRTNEGWAWLTVPVQQKNHYTQLLKETRIDNSTNWNKKHCSAIRFNYSKAPFFESYYPYFDSIYQKQWEFLVDLCYEIIGYLKEALNINTQTFRSSDFLVEGSKSNRILSLCQKMRATHYLTGNLAHNYLSGVNFSKKGVELEYQEYDHPSYSQQYSGFVPNMSLIDLLFNAGDKSLDVLMNWNIN